jgi:hypothetical protein
MADKMTKSETLQVRVEPEMIDRLNAQRRLADDPPSRAQMARILMEEALDAREAKAKRKG